MAVVAQRDVAEFDLRRHAHLIATSTTAHSPALTASAAAKPREHRHAQDRPRRGLRRMRRRRAMAMGVAVVVGVVVGMVVSHGRMLYYNITEVHAWAGRARPYAAVIRERSLCDEAIQFLRK